MMAPPAIDAGDGLEGVIERLSMRALSCAHEHAATRTKKHLRAEARPLPRCREFSTREGVARISHL